MGGMVSSGSLAKILYLDSYQLLIWYAMGGGGGMRRRTKSSTITWRIIGITLYSVSAIFCLPPGIIMGCRPTQCVKVFVYVHGQSKIHFQSLKCHKLTASFLILYRFLS